MDAVSRASPLSLVPLSGEGTPVVVGLGANLGEPRQTFIRALRAMSRLGRLCRLSPLYRSAPVGPEQPDFLNAAVLLEYQGELARLLSSLQSLENEAGRVRAERWGPRPLDLDILWAGEHKSCTSSLTIPHPELIKRAFAIRPLLDVFPEARDPNSGAPYASILRALEEQRCDRVEGEKWWDEIDVLPLDV